MNIRLPIFFVLLASIVASVNAQSLVASESRDASAAYIFTQNFVIGRTARDCFPLLGRTDTPKSFEIAWQQRNARYMTAAITYMNRRLVEAESSAGAVGRNRVASALNAAIAKEGLGAVEDILSKGDKPTACKKVIGLMEAATFDIDSRSPMFDELRALVSYVETT